MLLEDIILDTGQPTIPLGKIGKMHIFVQIVAFMIWRLQNAKIVERC
jgi:hypothetical protein